MSFSKSKRYGELLILYDVDKPDSTSRVSDGKRGTMGMTATTGEQKEASKATLGIGVTQAMGGDKGCNRVSRL